jgi:hypothetical protein
MGRAMLIIVASVLVSVGITQTSLFSRLGLMVDHSANYAEAVQAKNIAYMGTELAIREMIDNPPDWKSNETFTFSDNIGGGNAAVIVNETTSGTLKLVSNASFNGASEQITMLLQQNSSSKVPTFISAMGLLFEDEGQFTGGISGGGNKGGVDGNDASGTCDSVPGVLVPGNRDKTELENIDDKRRNMDLFRGDPGISVDENLSFDEVAKLIKALEAANPTYLSTVEKTNYLGTEDNPGVFFVQNGKAEIAGNTEGYGIMVVKNTGEVDVPEAELTLSGNVKFNGLVIFENAFNLTNNGTVDIFGSVLVGKTHQGAIFDFQFNGNARIQYDCSAQQYADMAASGLGSSMNFQALSIYETSDNSGN